MLQKGQTMWKRMSRWIWRVSALIAGGSLWGSGCAGGFQNELEVLFRPEANLFLIRDSVLVDIFGPQILNLFN